MAHAPTILHNLGFARLLALTHDGGPSVVHLRSQSVLPDDARTLVFATLRQHDELLKTGALIVIDTAMSRARILPIKLQHPTLATSSLIPIVAKLGAREQRILPVILSLDDRLVISARRPIL